MGHGWVLKSKQLHPILWLGFNINDLCLMANIGVTVLMSCSIALASIQLTVGIAAGYLIEEGLLLESLLWMF